MTFEDIDFVESQVFVVRKGSKDKQAVSISDSALDELKTYLTIRTSRYKIPSTEKALWISGNRKGSASYSVLSVGLFKKW